MNLLILLRAFNYLNMDCCSSYSIVYRDKAYNCSLAFCLQLIGDKYKSLILYHLKDGELRSGELQKRIHGISNRMFTFTIRALERDALVERKVYPEVPPKVVYQLSEKAHSIIPILLDLDQWAKDFAKDNNLYSENPK